MLPGNKENAKGSGSLLAVVLLLSAATPAAVRYGITMS
jgi:hypothetical protein